MKERVCGFIVLVGDKNRILGCRPFEYGTKEYDIPKGHKEEPETDFECAIRELYEETNIKLDQNNPIYDCGIMDYKQDKDIHLYITKINQYAFDRIYLKCRSRIDKGVFKGCPEMTEYDFPRLNEFYPINLRKVIKNCLKIFENDTNVDRNLWK